MPDLSFAENMDLGRKCIKCAEPNDRKTHRVSTKEIPVILFEVVIFSSDDKQRHTAHYGLPKKSLNVFQGLTQFNHNAYENGFCCCLEMQQMYEGKRARTMSIEK